MIGRKIAIILLFKKEELFHKFISYHCAIQLLKCIFWKKINALKTYYFLLCGTMHCLAEKMHRSSRSSKSIKNGFRISVV
jgi:hypothetical protein